MLNAALAFALTALTAAMALNIWRLVRGPTLPDRIMALDTLAINAIGLLVVIGIHINSVVFFEAALLVAMMGFVGTVALCKHVMGQSVIE